MEINPPPGRQENSTKLFPVFLASFQKAFGTNHFDPRRSHWKKASITEVTRGERQTKYIYPDESEPLSQTDAWSVTIIDNGDSLLHMIERQKRDGDGIRYYKLEIGDTVDSLAYSLDFLPTGYDKPLPIATRIINETEITNMLDALPNPENNTNSEFTIN